MTPKLKLLTTFALGAGAALAVMFAVRARAAGIPDANVLTYTGYLEDADGQPLSGDHSISVRFWESEEATNDLCTGELDSVTLESGRFQVPLPVECADAVKANPNIWVDVDVDGASLGRTKLGAVPFAIEAGHATSADTADSASGELADQLADLADGLAAVPKITAWASFTPTVVTSVGGAVTGVSTNYGTWRRVGDSVEVRITTRFNTDVASSDYLTWALPNGLLPTSPPDGQVIGSAEIWNGAVANSCAVGLSVSDNRIYLDCHGASSLSRGQVGVAPKWRAILMEFTVPVEGWTLTTP